MEHGRWYPLGISVLVGLAASLAPAAHESPQSFTLDGMLLAADHVSPLRDASAKVRVQVLNPAKTCVLYDEEQTVNTLSSNGRFNIQVGSAVGASKRRALDSANAMSLVYQNASSIPAQAAPSQTCTGSSYSPATGDVRYVRVIVTPTSSAAETLSPDMILDSTPSALVAQSLQGVEKSGFLQVNPAAQLTQSHLEQLLQTLTGASGMGVTYDGSNFATYDPHDGSQLTPGSVTDTQISSLAWAKISSMPSGISAIASLSCANGEILKMASGSWTCAVESGVGAESDPTVAAYAKNAPGAGLTVSGGAIVADFGTGAGEVAQGNDSRFTDSRAPTGTALGDLSGSYPAPSVIAIRGRGISATAPADGQVLRYDNGSSTWIPVNFGIDDLKTSMGTAQFTSASCTSAQTLIWSAVTDDFQCTNISLPASQVTGTLAIANGGTGAATASAALTNLLPAQSGHNGHFLQSDGTSATWVANSFAETDPKVGANTANYLSKWDGSALVASTINESSGKVGVNVTTPGVSLDTSSNTDAIGVPRGTTAQRPGTPANGYLRYNSDQKGFEAYINGSWQQFSAGSSPTVSEDGKTLRWNNTTQQFEWFTAGAAGSGLANLNGATVTTQSFAIGTSNNSPTWSTNTGTGAHTLHIPMANTASVMAGLLSKTEYDTFNNKVGTNYSLAGDVTGTPAATVVDRIKGITVSATPTLAGQVLRYTGAQFTPAFVSMADLRSQTTGTTALASSCTANQTLTYNSVGDNLACSNISVPVGQVTGTLPVTNGGTGQTTASAAFDALAPAQATNSGKFLTTNGTTTSWATAVTSESDPKVGANTANYLSKWNGTALVASSVNDSAGKVGINVVSPAVSLDASSNTDAIGAPRGTTAQRPATPANGFVRYNTDQKGFEAYINGSWQQFAAGASPTASEDGKTLRWNSTTQQFDWFTAGTAGAGIATFNGSSNSSQSLVVPGTAGLAPNWSTNAGTGAHTLNIPLASTASVTAGLLSKTDYDAFSAKLGTSTSFVGDVSGNYNTTSVDKIKGVAVSAAAPSTGNVLTYNGTNWAGATPSVTTVTGTLPIANGGTGQTTASAAFDALAPAQGSQSGKFLTTNGTTTSWATALTTESDPKVGSNTTNYVSKWNGTALVASTINESSGKVGINVTTPGVSFDTSSNTDAIGVPRGTTAQRPGTPANGYLRYNSDLKGFEAYINGSWQQFSAGSSPTASEDGKTLRWNNSTQQFDWFTAGAAGSGLANLNGATVTTQSFAIGTSNNSPTWSTNTGSGAHTLHIPMANTASVTAGLISKAEFDSFNAKLSAISNTASLANNKIWIGDGSGKAQEQSVTGDISISTAGLTVVNKIKGIPVSATPTLAGQVLRYDGSTNFVPAFISMADLRSQTTGTAALAASCASNQTLTYNSVGDNLACSNISLPVGQVTGTLPVANGGTGAATLTGYVKGNGTGVMTASATIAAADISGNITGNATNVTGTVAIANGGTGQTTAVAAFNALSPMTTLGDLIYQNSATTATRLAGNTAATKMFLSQTGTGSVSAAPVWSALSISDIGSGTLAVANGGTGATTLTDHGVLFGSGTGAVTASAAGSAGQILRSGGAAADPAWSTATYPATTTANGLLYSSAANTVGEIATANTGALVTSSAGVPSWTLGSTANRVLRTNGTAITFSQVALSTDVTGTLPVANGGTGAATLTGYVKGNGTSAMTASATIPAADISGNITGNAANVTGTVAIANGGTGQTTATAAFNALAPSQTSQSGKFLSTNGTNTSWANALTSESDPKVGANTTNYISKWNGSALVASTVIESGGDIGIGTAAPSSALHVSSSRVFDNADAPGTAHLHLEQVSGAGANNAYGPGLVFGKIGGNRPGAAISSVQTTADNDQLGLAFFTHTLSTSTNTLDEAMRINHAGNVGIGTTNPTYKLHVVGTAGLSTGTAWTNASDLRLKDIHGDYEYGLNEVLKLHTVRYNYKKDNPLGLPSDFEKTGFIAQEVQKVIPDAVNERQDGYLELNVDPIHWAVVNAIKEFFQRWSEDRVEVSRRLAEKDAQIAQKDREIAEIKSYLCAQNTSAPFCK